MVTCSVQDFGLRQAMYGKNIVFLLLQLTYNVVLSRIISFVEK